MTVPGRRRNESPASSTLFAPAAVNRRTMGSGVVLRNVIRLLHQELDRRHRCLARLPTDALIRSGGHNLDIRLDLCRNVRCAEIRTGGDR